MRLTTILFSILAATTLSLAACGGGDDGGGGGGGDDAPDANDQVVVPDANEPVALMGLGQRCVPAMQNADCPATAPACLSAGAAATTGICSKVCVASSTFMTNGATPPVPGAFNPDPTTQNGQCTAIFTGTAGTAACNTPANLTPAHNPLMANTTYTVLFACGIQCGAGNTCPGDLTCNTASMSCQP